VSGVLGRKPCREGREMVCTAVGGCYLGCRRKRKKTGKKETTALGRGLLLRGYVERKANAFLREEKRGKALGMRTRVFDLLSKKK